MKVFTVIRVHNSFDIISSFETPVRLPAVIRMPSGDGSDGVILTVQGYTDLARSKEFSSLEPAF